MLESLKDCMIILIHSVYFIKFSIDNISCFWDHRLGIICNPNNTINTTGILYLFSECAIHTNLLWFDGLVVVAVLNAVRGLRNTMFNFMFLTYDAHRNYNNGDK